MSFLAALYCTAAAEASSQNSTALQPRMFTEDKTLKSSLCQFWLTLRCMFVENLQAISLAQSDDKNMSRLQLARMPAGYRCTHQELTSAKWDIQQLISHSCILLLASYIGCVCRHVEHWERTTHRLYILHLAKVKQKFQVLQDSAHRCCNEKIRNRVHSKTSRNR